MHLFYSVDVFHKDQSLSLEESQHCMLSLRKNIGDAILITEGKGKIYSAKIKSIKNKKVLYSNVELQLSKTRKTSIHIAISPTKNKNRFEWFLEKATEIGIDIISPVICEKSEKKTINQDRCNKILISAMKQSHNCILPKINTPVSFNDFINNNQEDIYIAHCHKIKKIDFKNIVMTKKITNKITVMIGPEGDFSALEIALSEKNNFVPIYLGHNRLRTETAGIFVCSMLQLLQ